MKPGTMVAIKDGVPRPSGAGLGKVVRRVGTLVTVEFRGVPPFAARRVYHITQLESLSAGAKERGDTKSRRAPRAQGGL